jgi:hypothetical protein
MSSLAAIRVSKIYNHHMKLSGSIQGKKEFHKKGVKVL